MSAQAVAATGPELTRVPFAVKECWAIHYETLEPFRCVLYQFGEGGRWHHDPNAQSRDPMAPNWSFGTNDPKRDGYCDTVEEAWKSRIASAREKTAAFRRQYKAALAEEKRFRAAAEGNR